MPFGDEARDWLERYISESRPRVMLGGQQTDDLFVTSAASPPCRA